jgi:Tfp pilus assembly protein PilO
MDRSKKILILSLIPVLLTLIFILYIVIPTVSQLNTVNKEFKQEKISYDDTKSRLDSLNGDRVMLKKIEETKEKLANFDINVPTEDDLSILLIDLEKFGETFNVKVIGMNTKPEEERELSSNSKKKTRNSNNKKTVFSPLYTIPLEISAVGFYQDILGFVNILENYERKITINSVKIENYKEDKEVAYPRVQMTIDAAVYKFDTENAKLAEEIAKTNNKN